MEGFIALRLSLCLTLLVKNCGLEPFQMISLLHLCPVAFSSCLSVCQCIVPIPVFLFLFSVVAGSAMGFTLNLLPFSPQPLMVENNGPDSYRDEPLPVVILRCGE